MGVPLVFDTSTGITTARPFIASDNVFASGVVASGVIASGAVQGFFGTTRNIASGTLGVFDFGSGAVIAGAVGSGAIVSGNIASGQIGQFHIASGAVTSGRLGVTGTPDGTKFLRDDFTWSSPIISGSIQSGMIASGAVQGFFGSTRNIASGTVGVFDFGSGAVIAGTVGSGAIVSGNVASGQIGQAHLASGIIAVFTDSVSAAKGNVAAGPGVNAISGSRNTAFGYTVLNNSRGSSGNTGFGFQSLFACSSGWYNTAIGATALVNFQWGSGNVAVGAGAIGPIDGTFGMSGASSAISFNTAIGQQAGTHISSGALNNVLVGAFAAGSGLQAGHDNTVIGTLANVTNPDAAFRGVFGAAAVDAGVDNSVFIGRSGRDTVYVFRLASGTVTSGMLGVTGTPDGTKFLRDDFTWASPIISGSIQSGMIASGAVQGFFGSTRHIASGTVGVFDFGSGAVIAGTVGSGAIVSGNVASGQVGQFAISSGAVTSGRLGVTGTPDGTKFLRDDFTWTAPTATVASGGIQSGMIASGAVQGFFGSTRHIASGTVGVFDFGSGAVIAGTVGSGAIVSGNIASGQLSTFHFASGAKIDSAEWLIDDIFVTNEVISGGKAVAFNQSGQLVIAMAGVSGRMPAVGILPTNVASGSAATIYRNGRLFNTIFNFSGWTGSEVFVGQSGDVVASGNPTNSGAVQQILGVSIAGSGIMIQIGDPFLDTIIQSGSIGSGAVQGFFGSTPNIASGTVGVFDFGSGAVIAGTIGSGAVVSGNIASGQVGNFAISSGAVTSGRLGVTGTPDGTKFLRDDFTWVTPAGGSVTSGGIQSGMIASGAVQGFFGSTRHIASGTIGVFDFGSGAVIAGAVGSGAIVSGNVASGQISTFHFASGAGIDSAEWIATNNFSTAELISGGKAVAFNQSGQLVIAMAGVPSRMPAIGILPTNEASGNVALVYRNGRLFNTVFNFSGWTGQSVFVGQSGDVVASGSPTNSGAVQQALGESIYGSGLMIQLGDPFLDATILSGQIGSGTIGGIHIASGQIGNNQFASGNMPNPGYLYGLGLTWVSSGQIIVGSGVAMDSTGYTNIWLPTRTTVMISGTNGGPASMDISPIGNVSILTSGSIVSGATNMFLLWPMKTGTGLIAFSGTAGIVGSGGDSLNQIAVGDLVGTSGQSFWRVTAVNSGTFTTAISGGLTSGSKLNIIENAFFSTSGQISCVVNNILSGISMTLGGVPKASGNTVPGFIGGAPNNVTSGFQSYLMAWVSQGLSGTTAFLSTQRTTPLVSGINGYQTYFRRVGSVIYNGFSGQIVPFDQWGNAGYGKFTQFEVPNHTNNTVIFSGTLSGLAAVWAGLDCSKVAPPTATAIKFNAINTSPTSGGAIYFRKRGAGESTGTRNIRSMGLQSGLITSYLFDCACDGVQSIEYAWPISGLQLQLDVVGYFEPQF